MTSPREQIQNDLVDFLNEGNWTAPYGILTGLQATKNGGKYRSITFGRARSLDAEICIFGESYILLKWQGSLGGQNSRNGNSAVFHSPAELKEFLRTA